MQADGFVGKTGYPIGTCGGDLPCRLSTPVLVLVCCTMGGFLIFCALYGASVFWVVDELAARCYSDYRSANVMLGMQARL